MHANFTVILDKVNISVDDFDFILKLDKWQTQKLSPLFYRDILFFLFNLNYDQTKLQVCSKPKM